ncbi:SGNH/GDSL hydrolase family protein [Pedobacter duraquae]|uniref:GDSL-like lipase/acylhydrolase family protein n=1 Tax=Pedobacter duraquae TaxID=425511 RepID=A0A4R6IRJ4_9SPHI|nr:SGNH/GDSL hydrolase family protein [Pedobacter duraquae]TDO24887.1 hypothetical protein CLV32_1182 [Pedobacter duraquae]
MYQNFRNTAVVLLLVIICSCKKQVEQSEKKVLILGNSMTIHAPNAEIGWYGNWGMAASSKDKDYVHVLEARLGMPVIPVNISAWEGNHKTFDLSTLDSYLNQNPFVVVIRLGENVQDLSGLNTSLYQMIDYIQVKLPKSKILITGTFWNNIPVNIVLAQVAKQHNIPFVKLSQLDITENVSFLGATVMSVDGTPYKITNQAVAGHPGDLGMERMANEIYLGIESMMQQAISR